MNALTMTYAERAGVLLEHVAQSVAALEQIPIQPVIGAAELIIQTLKSGGKIMLCGNGGSAADAQHIAAELMGRYKVDRPPLSAIALTTDTSALTAIANDYGYSEVFSRQVHGLGKSGDCLIAISTSGNSTSILNAMEMARWAEIKIIGLTGQTGGNIATDSIECHDGVLRKRFEDFCSICIKVPSTDTPIIQQCHITIGHILCALVEAEFTNE